MLHPQVHRLCYLLFPANPLLFLCPLSIPQGKTQCRNPETKKEEVTYSVEPSYKVQLWKSQGLSWRYTQGRKPPVGSCPAAFPHFQTRNKSYWGLSPPFYSSTKNKNSGISEPSDVKIRWFGRNWFKTF